MAPESPEHQIPTAAEAGTPPGYPTSHSVPFTKGVPFFQTRVYYLSLISLKLMILLPWALKHWDYRDAQPFGTWWFLIHAVKES